MCENTAAGCVYVTSRQAALLYHYTRVYQKFSRLVPPSVQQLLQRKALVDGGTTMSSESVCQVARSWVELGSFHTRLLGVVYVTCGDFHDGSEKGTASVHQILCQSWDKWYGASQNDSTSLWGPMFESCIDVSMACPVQDRSHIS
jgi:hypothetical protein